MHQSLSVAPPSSWDLCYSNGEGGATILGRGEQVKFYQYKKVGGGEKSLAMLKGGRAQTVLRLDNTGAWVVWVNP